MRTRIWPVIVSVLLLIERAAGGQLPVPAFNPPQGVEALKGSAILMGQVVDSSGAGVGGAMLILDGGLEAVGSSVIAANLAGGPRRTLTADDGRFVFFDLPKGRYSIDAAKPGYLAGRYGQTRFNGEAQSIELAEGQRQTQIKIALWEYAAIAGRVIDETGEPVVGVPVRALPRVLESGRWRLDTAISVTFRGETDDRGEYRTDGLPPGDYVVAVPSTYTTVPQSFLPTTATGAAGRTGGPGGAAGSFSQVGQIQSGSYSLLAAGRFALVIPSPEPGRPTLVYPTTFYPGARSTTHAQVITLGSGEERVGVNLQLALVPATEVSGIIVGSEPPPRGHSVRLQPDYISQLTTDRGFEAGIATVDAEGRFRFLGVTPGDYTLRADVTIGLLGSADRREPTASMPITVGEAGLANVTLTLARGVTVSGRVAFDGALPKPGPQALQRFAIRLDPTDPFVHRSQTAHRASVDGAGNFRIGDVPPGKYIVKFSASADDRRAMAGWESVGATLGGRDVSTRPMAVASSDVNGIVLTLSDHAGRLTGTVRDASGKVDSNASVLLFTTERELWLDSGLTNRRLRAVRAAGDGTFVIPVVHSGEYFLTAIPDEDAANWNDPLVMDRIARTAKRVVFGENERKTQDVTTRAVR